MSAFAGPGFTVSCVSRPLPITVLATLAVLNGLGVALLAALASMGSGVVWSPQGVGPNRIALADVFGALRGHTVWLLACFAVLLVVLGVGLFRLRAWARWGVVVAMGVAALGTLVAIVWAVRQREWGVVAAGLVKVTVEVGLCYYLLHPARSAFVGAASTQTAR
jgi:hypothetical protein